MKILIIGSGGREHALAWKVKKSPHVKEVFCAPGNAGTARFARNVDLKLSNIGALALWAIENKIDLTIVGPEEPLSRGFVDIFEEHGLRIFGPSKAAAQLEASKIFSKEIMLRSGVKTAKGAVFSEFAAAKDYLMSHGAPIVVKADGLAAGKGVVVAETTEQALSALEDFMVRGAMGEAGTRVVLEERLEGEEASVIAVVDGDTVIPFVVSQDYKRLQDGSQGPNTGGMGSISPTPVLGETRVENLVGELFLPVISELWSRGIRYRGFLYAGVMVSPKGEVHVLEFNCRLGDPETQVLLMRMQSDLVEIIDAAVSGKLATVDIRWKPEAAACVVIASGGYPGTVDDEKVISGLFDDENDLVVFHAGTAQHPSNRNEVISKGGRILGVTATGATLNAAVKRAYDGVSKISFDGMQYRKDIGGGAW